MADLARINLSEAEEVSLTGDLEHILAYVEKLKQAETGAVEPLAHVLGSINVMRADEPPAEPFAHTVALVEAAPVHKDGYIVVRSVWSKKD